MKNIADLIKIVTVSNFEKSQRPKTIEGIRKTDALLNELSKSMSNNQIRMEKKSVAYRKLKSRLSEKLIQNILRKDPDQLLKNTYDKLYYKCLRNILLANVLYLNYSRRAANELLDKNVSLAIKYHFTDVSINSLRLLRYHAAFDGNKSKFNHYNVLLKKSMQLLASEVETERCSQELIIAVHHSTSSDLVRRNRFKILYKKISELADKYPSRTNMLNYFRVGIRLMEFTHRHRMVLKICSQAEEYLRNHPNFIQKARLSEFALYKMGSCLQLSDLEQGKRSANECEKLFQSGTDNWFIYLEWYFLLCMHTNNYIHASEILNQVKTHHRFSRQQQVRIEKWRIYEAYLHFILPAGNQNRFNLYKFLNEVPLHSSDKSGFNVSILIAQIICLISLGNFDSIIVKSDALKIYCQRYIRLKENYRTYYFMKMLQVMIKYSFEPVKTEQISRKYFTILSESKKEGKSLEEMEVIPYEILWMNILHKLREG